MQTIYFISEYKRYKKTFDIQLFAITILSSVFVISFLEGEIVSSSSFISTIILTIILSQFFVLIVIDSLLESVHVGSKINKFSAINSKIKDASYMNKYMDSFFGRLSSLKKYKKEFTISASIGKLKNTIYEYLRKKQIAKHRDNIDPTSGFYNKFLEHLKNKNKPIFEVVEEQKVAVSKKEKQEKKEEEEEEVNETPKEIQSEDINVATEDDEFYRKKDDRTLQKSKQKSKFDFGQTRYIPVHIFETDNELTIEAEVGDVNIYDLDISINDGVLCVKSSENYGGTFFERYIGINIPIHEESIDINLEDGELIIVCSKILNSEKLDKNEKKDEPKKENQKLENNNISEETKAELLESFMEDEEPTKVSSKQDRHHISYKVKEIHDHKDHDVIITITLNGLTIDHIKLEMKNNVINILEHDTYTGAPFHLDITLDSDLIHSSIKTKSEGDNLIITAKYRPEHVEVTDIKSEEENF